MSKIEIEKADLKFKIVDRMSDGWECGYIRKLWSNICDEVEGKEGCLIVMRGELMNLQEEIGDILKVIDS